MAVSLATAEVRESAAHSGRRFTRRLIRLDRLATHVILLAVCLLWLVPTVAMLVTAFRSPSAQATSGWWQAVVHPDFTLSNFSQSFSLVDIGSGLVGSALLAVPATILVAVISAIAGYAFAWMRFPGRRILFLAIVSLLVIPPQVLLAPMLRLMNLLGLTGTLPAVWIFQVGVSIPFGILVLRSAFASLPPSLIEAGQVDGASHVTIFTRIATPVSLASIAAVATIQFLWSWNDLLSPLIFIGPQGSTTPVTVQIADLAQGTGAPQNLEIASGVIALVVPMVVFVALQRYFVRGVLGGTVKG